MSEAHAVLLYCPYCGEEDLRPHGDVEGAWECRSCARVFSVKLLGLSTVAFSSVALSTLSPEVSR
jgi:transposase-like protein